MITVKGDGGVGQENLVFLSKGDNSRGRWWSWAGKSSIWVKVITAEGDDGVGQENLVFE